MTKPKETNHQYFTVSAAALVAMAKQEVSALAICSYLALSRFSISSAKLTAASANIIRGKFKKGKAPVEKAMDELLNCTYENNIPIMLPYIPEMNFKSICDSDEEGEEFREAYHRQLKRQVKHPKFNFININHSILVSNSLVDYNCCRFNSLIRSNNKKALVLLLAMYYYYNYSLDAVKYNHVHIQCNNIQELYDVNSIVFWNGKLEKTPFISDVLGQLIFCGQNFIQSDVIKLFKTLEDTGLIQRVVYVLTRNGSETDVNYELDIKTEDQFEKLSCHNLAYRMRQIVRERGFKVGRKDNRFYNEYVFAAPSASEVAMVVLYRLPFAMRNPNNKIFLEGEEARQANYERVCSWLDQAEQKDGFLHDTSLLSDFVS